MFMHNPASIGDAQQKASTVRVVSSVFALLDRESISYCLVHGYEGLPQHTGSDIDIIIARDMSADRMLSLFSQNQAAIGAAVVRARGLFITFRATAANGLPLFITFDFCADYTHGPLLISTSEALLAKRRRCRDFWVAAPEDQFRCRLLRALLKNGLDTGTCARLSALYLEAPKNAVASLTKDWSSIDASAFGAAAAAGQWSGIVVRSSELAAELRSRLRKMARGHFIRSRINQQAGRARRIFKPEGINVVLLGPDGAGKSSTIAALETVLAPLFSECEIRGFAPTLKQLLRRSPSSTSTPHALKPRSLPTSLLRAGWWTIYGLFSHVILRWDRIRSRLILNDRHFVDILVDPVRYRYGGPRWLLALIWRIMPKPDHVILLHGPADILQARKRELTVEETARQCRDYEALVRPMKNSHIVDATLPFHDVVGNITDLLLARIIRSSR